MGPFKRFRFKTIFLNLFFTYLLVSLFIVMILGGSLYYFFSAKYKEQVMLVNNKMIQQEKNTIESAYLQKIQALYLDLSSSNLNGSYDDFMYFFENSPNGNYLRLYSDVDYLKHILVNYTGVIDAIHIYVPKNNLFISTTWGIQYLNSLPSSYPESIPWFPYTKTPPVNGKWIDTRPMANAFYPSDVSNGITYVRIFPLFNKGMDMPGVIAFDMNESYISAILRNNQLLGNNTFIINGSGEIVFSPDSNQLYEKLAKQAYIRDILGQKKENGNFIRSIDGEICMVSYDTIGLANWKIVSVTPVNEYYRQVAVIRNIFALLCFLTAGISIVLTFLFSKKVYHPLNMIVRNIRTLFSTADGKGLNHSIAETGNEYSLISNTIGSLSRKIITLQPIARQNMFVSILSNTIESPEEFLTFEELSNVYFNAPFFNCMVVDIDKKGLDSLSMQKIFYENYMIVKCIEEMSNERITLHSIRLNRFRIGIIVNAKENRYLEITDVAEKLLFYTIREFDMTFTASVGRWTDNPLHLSACYSQALKCMEYKFYYPTTKLILYEDIEQRETNLQQCALSGNEFLQALNLQDPELVRKYVDKLAVLLTQKEYSASYSNRKLQELVDLMRQFIHAQCPDSRLGDSLTEEFKDLSDIHQYSAWIISKAHEVFRSLDDKKRAHNAEIISRVKKYVDHNIGYSLSLESAASYVSLTPKYLSRIFKDITGINFHDYLTERRLREGLKLLSDPKLNVDQISQKIGYSSTAYFIRQFKKYYGDTPSRYRTLTRSGTG